MKTEFKIVVYFINLLLYFYLFITFPVKFVFMYPIIFIIYIYLLRRKWRTPLSGIDLCVCNGYKWGPCGINRLDICFTSSKVFAFDLAFKFQNLIIHLHWLMFSNLQNCPWYWTHHIIKESSNRVYMTLNRMSIGINTSRAFGKLILN